MSVIEPTLENVRNEIAEIMDLMKELMTEPEKNAEDIRSYMGELQRLKEVLAQLEVAEPSDADEDDAYDDGEEFDLSDEEDADGAEVFDEDDEDVEFVDIDEDDLEDDSEFEVAGNPDDLDGSDDEFTGTQLELTTEDGAFKTKGDFGLPEIGEMADMLEASLANLSTEAKLLPKQAPVTTMNLPKVTEADLAKDYSSTAMTLNLVIKNSEGQPVPPVQRGEVFIAEIAVEDLHVPTASRLNYTDLEPLEKSMAEIGQVMPIYVIPFEKAEGFVVIKGKRRLRAARNLGMSTMKAIVDTTRNKTWLRYLEVILACSAKPYNFRELMEAGTFIQNRQPHLSVEVVERMLGMAPAGTYLEGKQLLLANDEEILFKVLQNKLSISQAFKALKKKQEKLEKELEKEALEQGLDLGSLQPSYGEVDYEPEQQSTKERHVLPVWLIEEIEKRDNHTCQSCGLGHEQPFLSCIYEKHHMIPVYKGGKDDKENLILLCRNCHSMAHAYVDGKFMPPKEEEEAFHNIIVIADIITKGPGGMTPYQRYLRERVDFWSVPAAN